MPRAIWTGTLQFVLISLPVKLYKATDNKGISFKTIHVPCGDFIHLKKWCNTCNREAFPFELNKGYELAKGQYVLFGEEEIENALPESSKTIKVEKAVAVDEIPAIVYEDSYFVAPDKGGEHVYNLLFNALAMKQKSLIGRVVMRSQEHLVAVRPFQDGLLLSMLHFADEIRDIHDVVYVKERKVDEKELALATNLLDHLTGNFNQIDQKDKYREYIEVMAEMKASGQVITIEPVKPIEAQVNIIEGLQQSIEMITKPGTAVDQIVGVRRVEKPTVDDSILELPTKDITKDMAKDITKDMAKDINGPAKKEIQTDITEEKIGVKQQLDKMYGFTDEEIDRIIFEQKIEEVQERANIMKELAGYKSFEDYVKAPDHKKEFEDITVGDDFRTIVISNDKYPRINLPTLKKIGIVAEHFAVLIFIKSPQRQVIRKKEEGKTGDDKKSEDKKAGEDVFIF